MQLVIDNDSDSKGKVSNMIFSTTNNFADGTAVVESKVPVITFDKPKNPLEVPNPDMVPELPPSPSPSIPLEIPEPDLIPEITDPNEDNKQNSKI